MFKRFVSSVCVLFLLSMPVFAQDKFVVPTQTVVGAEEAYPSNELIMLKVTDIKEKPPHLQSVQYNWVVLADDKEKKNVFVYPDKTTIGFGRGAAKKIQVILVIDYIYTVKDEDGKIIEVGHKSSGLIFIPIKFNDTPVPGPVDPVVPDPVLPDGTFGLAKTGYSLAIKHVPAVNRVKGAKAMTTGLSGIVASIRAGALTDPSDILTKVNTANNTALKNAGIDESEWDAFGTALQAELLKLYRADKLKTASDYADAFDELVTGLKAVK